MMDASIVHVTARVGINVVFKHVSLEVAQQGKALEAGLAEGVSRPEDFVGIHFFLPGGRWTPSRSSEESTWAALRTRSVQSRPRVVCSLRCLAAWLLPAMVGRRGARAG